MRMLRYDAGGGRETTLSVGVALASFNLCLIFANPVTNALVS